MIFGGAMTWNHDCSSLLLAFFNRKIEQLSFDRWCSQSVSSLSQSECRLDEPFQQVSDGSLSDPIETEELQKEPSRWNWLCCCDESTNEMKLAQEQACENSLPHAHSIIFHSNESIPTFFEAPPTPSIQSDMLTQETQGIPSTQSIQSTQSSLSTQVTTTSTIPSASTVPRRRISSVDSEDSRRSSIDDNGLGPFITSLKSTKRRVLRSSDFM